jgi:hypothetical protein
VRDERVEMKVLDANDPGMTVDMVLRDTGLKLGIPFPLMMQTEADLFPLSRIAGLDVATLARMQAEAVEKLGFPGGAVFRMRVWSGEPFWRARDGTPFVDIRVGVPPSFNASGYAVFTLDGQFVEAIR